MSNDIKLDPSTGDYEMSSQGMELFKQSEYKELVSQRVVFACKLKRGELFNRTSAGVPIRDLSRFKDEISLASEFMKQYILDVDGVDEILSYDTELQNDRVFRIRVSLRTNNNEVITLQI